MSFTGELKYPDFFSNLEIMTNRHQNNIIESIRYIDESLISHDHSGLYNGIQLGTSGIVEDSIITSKFANGSVTTIKLNQVSGQQSIITSVIRNLAITTAKIKDADIIISEKVIDGTITTIKLENGVASPSNQTAYGKDNTGIIGFNTLSIYGTNFDTLGNTIRLKNGTTVLATITTPYAVNAIQLDGIPATGSGPTRVYTNGIRCTDCTWLCTNSCGWKCTSCTASCENNCNATCIDGCGGGCKGTCTGTCSGSCLGTCSDSCIGGCASGCTGSCQIGCTGSCKLTCSGDCSGTYS